MRRAHHHICCKSRGWSLPSTLFGLAIIFSIAHILALESVDTSQILSEISRGITLHQATIEQISQTGIPGTNRCEAVSVQLEDQEANYEVCRESLLKLNANPESAKLPALAVDYDAIFQNSQACPGKRILARGKLETTPMTEFDCEVGQASTDHLISMDNLRSTQLSLRSNSEHLSTIASPGTIDLSIGIITPHDLLIVAGGDISIPKIATPSNDPINVTVLSALGDITITEVEAAISLLVLSRGKTKAPPTRNTGNHPLPPFRHLTILGFRGQAAF